MIGGVSILGGYHAKIVFSSYMSNLALSSYLVGLSYTVNWTYVQRTIDFHWETIDFHWETIDFHSEKLKLTHCFAES
jgi:hypothetical protein